jgi:hypothetical protein
VLVVQAVMLAQAELLEVQVFMEWLYLVVVVQVYLINQAVLVAQQHLLAEFLIQVLLHLL